jgi:hypothetical protein
MFECSWNFHTQREKLVSGNRPQHSENPKRIKHHSPDDTRRRRASNQNDMNDGFLRNREGKIVARFDGNILRDGSALTVQTAFVFWHATAIPKPIRPVGSFRNEWGAD